MKVLVATEKPFAAAAVEGIKSDIEGAGNELVLLEKYTEKQQLLDAVKDADAMIIRSDKVDAEVLDAAKQLKIVVRAGAGYDNIDLAAATAHDVVAENTPGQNANAVAELVFGMLVFAVRNFYNGKAGTELKGKKLGILAFGNVGRNVARIAAGFGMEVYAYDAFCPKEAIEAAGVKAVDSQDDLFKTCSDGIAAVTGIFPVKSIEDDFFFVLGFKISLHHGQLIEISQQCQIHCTHSDYLFFII